MPKSTYYFRLTAISALIFAMPAMAQEYAHGNGALEIFDGEGLSNSPSWVKVWVIIMLATFASGLLFIFKRLEARLAVGGFLLGMGAMTILTGPLGLLPFSGLIAAIHIVFWSPALLALLSRRTFLKERSLYGLWTGLMTVVILFSFVFDIRDAFIYLRHVAGV